MTALAAWRLRDGEITCIDARVLLGMFGGLMAWTIWQGLKKRADAPDSEMEQGLVLRTIPIQWAASGWLQD